MNAELLYLKVDKVNSDGTVTEGVAFPSDTEQVVLGTYTYEAKRMGGAPTITDSFYFSRCLDKEWKSDENNSEVYAEYNGERFYVSSIPSPTKDNTNGLYKHEITLTSRREILDNTLFFDVVTEHTDTQDKDRYRSNQTNFSFGGDIREFIKRINDSLVYVGIYDPTKEEGKQGYHLVLKDGYGTDDVKEISIDSQYITEVIQEIYNTYNLTYYWKGEVCYVGEYENDLTSDDNVVRYGRNEALLSVSEENSNNKIVDMITGYGSSDNIPYYYPNDDEFGEAVFEVKNGTKNSADVSLQKLLKNTQLGTDYLKTYTLCKRDGDLTGKIKITSSLFATIPSDKLVVSDGNYFLRTTIIPIIAKIGMRIYEPNITPKHTCIDGVSIKEDKFSFYINNDREGKYNDVYEVSKDEIVNLVISEQITISSTIGTVTVDNAITYSYDGDVKVEYENQSKYFWNYNGGILEYDESGISVQDKENSNVAKSIVSFKMITTDVTAFNFGYGFEEKMDDSTKSDALSVTITDRIWLDPSQNLMPSIYRESNGAERFYYALNNTHKIPGSDKYYEFKNKYVKGNPHQGSVSFDDIKPTINGIRNDVIQSDGLGQLFGEIADVAFDSKDSDVKDSNGEYVHQYFYIKLHKFSGEFGFDLFSHALAKENAVINMIDCQGCPACAFPIRTQPNADNSKMFNCVSVDESGNLVSLNTEKDDYILGETAAQSDKLNQNSQEKEIWIAVQKDNSTLGIVMPNAAGNFKPKKGDKFVITGIKPPKVLVTAAEHRLDEALIKYMSENNEDSFTYSIKFSRIFLAENPDYANKLNENAKICLEFNGVKHELFVSNYSVKRDGNALAEVDVELVKSLEVTQSEMKQMIDSVKGDVLNSIGSGLNTGSNNSFNAATADKMYLSKLSEDTAKGIITFMRGLSSEEKIEAKGGIYVGNGEHHIDKDGNAILGDVIVDRIHDAASTPSERVIIGAQGFDLYMGDDGKSHLYLDDLIVRRRFFASSAEIRKISYSGGTTIFSNAGSTLAKVSAVFDSNGTCVAYKCYACADDGTTKTMNWWHVGMMALCQTFNVKAGKTENLQNRYYWRLVVGVGQETLEDGKLYDYVVLSNKEKFLGSDSYVPTYTDKVIADENEDMLVFGDYGVEVTTDGGMGSMAGVFFEQEGLDTDDGGNKIANRYFYGYEAVDGLAPDAPAAGDVIVQVGDQIRWKSRGNLIKMSTSTEDNATDNAPAITMYHNLGALYATGKKDSDGNAIVSPYQWKTCTAVISPEMVKFNSNNFAWFSDNPDEIISPITVVYSIETSGMFRVGSDGKLYGDNKFQGSDDNRFVGVICYRTTGNEKKNLGTQSCFWETNYPEIFSIAASPYDGGIPLLLSQDKAKEAPSSVLVSCYSLAIDPTTHAPSKGDVLYASVNIPVIRDGEDGEKGEKGDKGDDGTPGTPGLDGADAVTYSVNFSKQKVQIGTDTYEERIYVYVTEAIGASIQTSIIYNAGCDFKVYVDGVEADGLKSVLKVNGYIGRSAWPNATTFQVNLYDNNDVLLATGSYTYGEKGEKGDDGESGMEIIISPDTLVYDTNDDGVVTNYSQSAAIYCNKGGKRYTNVEYSLYGVLNCEVTYSGGTIEITKIGTQTISYTDNGTSKSLSVSATSGHVMMRVIDKGTGLYYYPLLKFSVNVAKFTGSMVANNKKFQTQFTEISNKYDNLPNEVKTSVDFKKYTSSIEQTARKISLSVSEKAVGRRNLLVGSEFKRFDSDNMTSNGQTLACRLRTGDQVDGYNSCRIVSDSTSYSYNGVVFKNIAVNANTTYTLTTWAKRMSESLGAGCVAIVHEKKMFDGAAVNQQSWVLLSDAKDSSGNYIDAIDEWKLKTRTFTTQGTTRYINIIFCARTYGKFAVCKPILEEGDSYNGYSKSEKDYGYIGGNMIDNSRDLTVGGTLVGVGGTVQKTLNDDYADTIVTASGNASVGAFSIKKTLKAGVDYVLSWYIRRTSSDENGQCTVNLGRKILYSELHTGKQAVNSVEGGSSPYSGYQSIYPVPAEWTRMWVHFRLSEDWADTDNQFYIQLYKGTADSITAQLSRPKLEEGAYPTEWTDNPKTYVEEGSMANKLLATGVDIVNKKVTVTADNFTVRNNSGVETMMVNEDGTLNAALVKAQQLETLGTNGQRIVIENGLLSVIGLAGVANWRFGIDDNNKSVLSYYDDNGNKLYDLGPDGLTKVQITKGTFTSGSYVNATEIGLSVSAYNSLYTTTHTSTSATGEVSVTETRLSNTSDDTILFKNVSSKTLGEQFNKTTLYLYRAPRVNNVIQADSDNNLTTKELAQQADGKYFTSKTICNGSSIQNLASGCFFAASSKIANQSKFIVAGLGQFDSISLSLYAIQSPISITKGAKSIGIVGQIRSMEQYTQVGSAGNSYVPID